MYKWKKLGRVFNPEDCTGVKWINEFAQSPSVLVLTDVIRVYFSSRPIPDSQGQYVSYTGFLDLDRNNLFSIKQVSAEPILPLGDLGAFDEFGIYPASVIKTQDDIRVYYAGWTRCESVPFNAAIGVASSQDGKNFNKLGKGPVLSYSHDEPFVLGSPRVRKFNNTWYLWYVSGREWVSCENRPEPVYKIRMATSKDGINWNKHGQDLIPDHLEKNECQACPDVIYKNGIYHMFYSYRYHQSFKSHGRGYRIGYAYSKDLFNWTRCDGKAGIGKSDNGWDSESASYPHLFELDDQIYMLYQGNHIGKTGFGIAKLEGELK